MFIYLVTVSASKLEEVRLTFMAALLSKDQVKFSKLNSDFLNDFFCVFLSSLVYFLKTD